MRFDRHHIVRLDPERWPEVLAGHAEAGRIPMVVEWVGAGRPLIVRRPLFEDVRDHVPLGLPLPPSHGKQRLSFIVPSDALLSIEPPPLLADARIAAPAVWQDAIDAVVALDPATRCFGSLAWAYMTGLSYLTATSDLDLLWRVDRTGAVDRLLPALAAIAAAAPMRIDGEMVAPAGLAIQWQEWRGDAADLLAKTADGNRLVRRDAVFV